jgi:hypothetical protein
VAGPCECGNEPSGSIKCEELLASQECLCSMELVTGITKSRKMWGGGGVGEIDSTHVETINSKILFQKETEV